MMQQTKSSISTLTKFFDFKKPEEYEYDIREIAHALSNLCRYTGHVRRFYSVAEHSVLVSKLVPKEYALEGLLHDASEAFCGDVSKPLKTLLPAYERIEEGVQAAICSSFGLCHPFPVEVHTADKEAYLAERLDVARSDVIDNLWYTGYEAPKGLKIMGLPPIIAELEFMDRYWEIMDDRAKSVLREGSPETAAA